MSYSNKPNFYDDQLVMACKRNHDAVKRLESFKKIWIERCELPDDYLISPRDAFNWYLDLCNTHFPLSRFHLCEMITYASPEKCHEIGYWTEEVNKLWYFKPEQHRTEKYDYWMAMFCAITSYIRMMDIANIPFKLTDLEERFKVD